MKINKLIELLSEKDPEQTVMLYLNEEEMYGENIILTPTFTESNKNDLPYSKTDKPEIPEEGLVLIQA